MNLYLIIVMEIDFTQTGNYSIVTWSAKMGLYNHQSFSFDLS